MIDTSPLQLSHIRAISFDLDYTLWDLADVIQHAEQSLHEFLGREYPRAVERYSVEDLAQRRLELLQREPDLRHNVTQWRKVALRELAAECGYDESLVERGFDIFLDARHNVTPYEDALPLLDALHKRYRLGVITNGNADVRRLGLGHYFDFIVSAVDIGSSKPDHLIFEAACHRADVPAGSILHIGDEPESDVVGAVRYGMQAVWLNREGREWPAELERVPHLELDSLTALGELLEQAVETKDEQRR